MAQALAFAELRPGEQAKVLGFERGQRDYRHKLLSMGLTPNTTFEVIRHAPLGDPVQIKVRNFYLSLRKDEANLLRIERA